MARLHKQRLAVLAVAFVGILGCFIPLGRVPLVGSLPAIESARTVAVGVFGLTILFTLLGQRDKAMKLPLQIGSFSTTGVIVGFCIFRIIVLGGRTLPRFEDDDPRASVFYAKACDAGLMETCTRLGECYWTGSCGLAIDGRRGFELYEKACTGGEMNACGQLGVCYEIGGCGLAKNSERAVMLYEKACLGGDPSMCNNLGVCYNKGQCGLARDDTRAADLYRTACRGGDSSACHNPNVMKN